jgi:hypothetical protein
MSFEPYLGPLPISTPRAMPPVGAGGAPVEDVVQEILEHQQRATARSFATIMELVDRQRRLRMTSFAFGWLLAAALVVLAAYFTFVDVPAPPEVWAPTLSIPLLFVIYQGFRSRNIVKWWRAEIAQIEAAAIAAVIELSETCLIHKDLTERIIWTARTLRRRGGERYRRSLDQILSHFPPDPGAA